MVLKAFAFFNHKGGVGKTTLIFNVGLALAQQRRKVLFIDLDAQANLTAAALAPADIEACYENHETIAGAFQPLVDGSGDIAVPVPRQIRDDAWVIPGHIDLSEYEGICPEGWTNALAGNLRGLRVTTAPYRLAVTAAEHVGAEFVIFDVGPNVGAMNRNILLSCDGFIVPLAPDLFSLSALRSVGRSTISWVDGWARVQASFASSDLNFQMPIGRPSPLGYVSQQFAIYRQAPAEAYRRWLAEIPGTYQREVVEPLRNAGIRIPEGSDQIGEVRNLSSLVPMAQRSNLAVFELGGVEARGAQYTRAKDTLSMFAEIASEIIRRIDDVTG